MASLSSIISDIRTNFDDNFGESGAKESSAAVHYDNFPETDKPADGQWLRVRIQLDDSNQASLGTSRRSRRTGSLVVEINRPLHQGDDDAIRLADRIETHYRFLRLGNTPVRFEAPWTEEVGLSEGWYQWRAVAPFSFDLIG